MKYEKHGNDKHADLNLYICGRDENLPPGIKYGPVIRDAYIIECCTGGYGSVIINGTEFPIGPGDAFILLPGDVIIHTADEVEPREGVWCSVKGIKISSYLASLGINSKNPFVPREAFESTVFQIEQILNMVHDEDPGADLRIEACIHMIFGEMMRYAKGTSGSGYIQKALQIMEIHYAENLSVNDISTSLGLERCYFSTLFKKSTGKSPHTYLSELRIKKACALLADGQMSVSETAQAVGIDPIGFARIFKKHTNMLPNEYIKRKNRTV